ncbi:ABC transporter permease [Planomonospora venezuelensis]|uniref:Oligopeptide transport system permease protein n=1 Tax=Planomonospora venezuelensis TaxID=1999 RepID=A0A841D4R9_PLAVE|nr:ABC transporter permease [Planomonospora venezuelensis]MBB5965241.1 oligopeptide transport system permease protein [Planomonospora venezuelensis]GIN00525.1 peptide ABC transporter permease [Planomonospora venezuelensis]
MSDPAVSGPAVRVGGGDGGSGTAPRGAAAPRARHARRAKSPGGSPARPSRGAPAGRPASLWSDAWHELRRRPLFVAAAVLIGVILLMAAVPQLFTSVDPYDAASCRLGDARQAPSAAHWFGTDNQGCDTLARTVYGTRNSLLVGLSTTAVTVLVGGLLGLVAGFRGGLPDALLSRVSEVFFAIPSVLGALLILAVFRTGTVWTVMLALAVLAWPMTFRIMRAAVIAARGQDYVVAARALGASGRRIMFRHILPNAVTSVIVVATVNLGVFIAAEAGLSFLGVGIQSPEISWGLMIADARPRFLEAASPLLFPAAFLSLTVLAFIMLGDAVRDALDPKLR